VTDADLVFLPWVRRGAASGVLTPDTFGAAQPGQATATVTLTINAGTTVSVLTTVGTARTWRSSRSRWSSSSQTSSRMMSYEPAVITT